MATIEEAEAILKEIEIRNAKAKAEWEIEKNKTFRQRLEEQPARMQSIKELQLWTWKQKSLPEEKFAEYWEDLIDEKIKNINDFLKAKEGEVLK